MRGKTVTGLANELGFVDYKPLSKGLKDFVKSKGISRRQFVNIDRDAITSLATSYTRKVGRRYWGVGGKFPNFPDNEDFIVGTIAEILINQQRNTVDALKATARRNRSDTSEEPEDISEEEEEESSCGDDQNYLEAIRAVEKALTPIVPTPRTEQDSVVILSSREMNRITSDHRDPFASETRPVGHTTRPFIPHHTRSSFPALEPIENPRLSTALRSHKRDHDAMEPTHTETQAVYSSPSVGTEPALKQRRIAVDYVDATTQATGNPSAAECSCASRQVSSFSAINSVSYEPAPEQAPESPRRVQTLERATQTEGRLSFDFGLTRYSMDRINVEPTFLRILGRHFDMEFDTRSSMRAPMNEKEAIEKAECLRVLNHFRKTLLRDLVSSGIVEED